MKFGVLIVLFSYASISAHGQNQMGFSLRDCILDRTTSNLMKVYSSDTIKNVLELYEAFEEELIKARILNNNSKNDYIKLIKKRSSIDFSHCEFIQTHAFLGAMFVLPVVYECQMEFILSDKKNPICNYYDILILNQLQASGYAKRDMIKYVKNIESLDFNNIESRSGIISILMFKIYEEQSIN